MVPAPTTPEAPYPAFERLSETSLCARCHQGENVHEWRCKECRRLLSADGRAQPHRLCHGEAWAECPVSFYNRVMSARVEVEASFGGRSIAAERRPHEPFSGAHLSWVLAESLWLYEQGRPDLAERCYGFVLGALGQCGGAGFVHELRAIP